MSKTPQNPDKRYCKIPQSRISFRALCCTASLAMLASTPAMADSISFSQSNYSFNEVQGTVQLQVNYISDYGGECEFEVPVRDFFDAGEGFDTGSAEVEQDYTLDTTVLTFSVVDAGSYPATVNLTLNDDALPEDTENIILSFGPANVLAECATPNYDTSVSWNVDIFDSYTQQQTLSLEGTPGETVSTTFDIDTGSVPLNISSLREFNNEDETDGPATISPKTVTQATPTVITYAYTIPEDAAAGQSFSDTITIEPQLLALARGVGSTPDAIEIPVTITVASITPIATAERPIDVAWQSLCDNNTEDSKIAQHCARTPDGILNDEQLRDLSPEEMAAMASGTTSMINAQMKNVFYQQRARRAGIGGVDLNRLSFILDGQDIPVGRLMDHYLEQQTGGAAGDTSLGGRWSIFATGRVNSGDKDASETDSGYDFDTYGLTVGADYRASDQMILGGALGYAQMESNFGDDGGDLDINASTLMIYGSYFTANNFYVDASAFYTLNDYDFNREISSFATQTQGDTDGDQYAVSISVGMDLHANKLQITPYGRFEYIQNDIESYTESGGGGLALDVDSQDITSQTTALGGRLAYAASMRWGILLPTAHAEWIHEFNDDHREIIARFAQDPNNISFATSVGVPDSDFFNWGLGLSATLPAGRSLFVNYEGIAAQDNFTQHTVHLGGRVDF